MICRIGEATYRGRAVDLSDALGDRDSGADAAECRPAPATLATAVRTGTATAADGTTVEIAGRAAGPLHERVGCLVSDCSLRPRTALALAARTRGWTTPVDDRLADARERLAALGVDEATRPPADLRRRRAEVDEDVERLRERAAEARGRIQAESGAPAGGGLGDGGGADSGTAADGGAGADASAGADADAGASADDLTAAIRDLSEAETAAAAARQRHRSARETAREHRDRLQERLCVADEVANLEREARAHLVERAREPYERALAAVPGGATTSDPFAAAPDAMGLAIARVGDVAAPLVVACDRFARADAAARWLGAPVVRL